MNLKRPQFRWPLAVPHFNVLDRMKVASFFIGNNRLTHDKKTLELEKRIADCVGSKYALFTSSGSTANTLLAMTVRDKEKARNTVVVPSMTWATSISPWIREGFRLRFIDSHPLNLGMNLDLLERYLKESAEEVACVFVTSLLGFSPDIDRLKVLSKQYGVTVMLDNCESTLSSYKGRNISSEFTSTTSSYFGHFFQTIEGGFVFTNDEEVYESCVLLRDHGLSRCLRVNPFGLESDKLSTAWGDQFKIHRVGSNFRNTEVGALMGLMELKRLKGYRDKRVEQVEAFRDELKEGSVSVPSGLKDADNVLFALPLLSNKRARCLGMCSWMGIETRPLVCGNLLQHPAFADYKAEYYMTLDVSKYQLSNGSLAFSDEVHARGFYVGLGCCTDLKKVRELARAFSTDEFR